MFSTNSSKICCSFAKNKFLKNARLRPEWLKFIWQFGDVVEFWLWGLMLPWQQHLIGHV